MLKKMFFVGFCVFILNFELAFSFDGCLSQTSCSCILPNNTIIDLSTVGSPEYARFYSIPFNTNCSSTVLYSYNPCFAFDSPDKETVTESGYTPCIGASACIKVPGGTEGQLPKEHAIGLQKTATFGVNNNSIYYINYTVPLSSRILRVELICDENFNGSKLSMVEPECSNKSEIVLRLTSKCACADGCKSSIPSPSSTGLSTGSKLLIAFFTIAIAYLLIGVVWNYCNGSHGVELIPNVEFWNDLPTLIMEGIAFSCSCCVKKSSYGEVYG